MDRVIVQPGETLEADFEGRQLFVGGGGGGFVKLHGNPADYSVGYPLADEEGGPSRYALIARNGTGEYQFDASIERIGFVSSAYTLVRNLPAVIAAPRGSRPPDAIRATRRSARMCC